MCVWAKQVGVDPPRVKDSNQLRLDMITVGVKSIKMSEGVRRSCGETPKKSWPITNTQDLINKKMEGFTMVEVFR